MKKQYTYTVIQAVNGLKKKQSQPARKSSKMRWRTSQPKIPTRLGLISQCGKTMVATQAISKPYKPSQAKAAGLLYEAVSNHGTTQAKTVRAKQVGTVLYGTSQPSLGPSNNQATSHQELGILAQRMMRTKLRSKRTLAWTTTTTVKNFPFSVGRFRQEENQTTQQIPLPCAM